MCDALGDATLVGIPGDSTRREETKIRYEPSGAIAGDESDHSPEKEATVGFDHWPRTFFDSRMIDHFAVLRVK